MFILRTAAVWLKNEFHRWSLFIWGRKIGSFHPDAEMLLLAIAINTWVFNLKDTLKILKTWQFNF